MFVLSIQENVQLKVFKDAIHIMTVLGHMCHKNASDANKTISVMP